MEMGQRLMITLVSMAMVLSGVNSARHIVLIVADDLGWNDVGFHNPDMITPNIDELAQGGVILNSSYVQPTCTPSRHAIMTGTYPFRHGIQRNALFPGEPKCSPLDLKFFPQQLQSLGYKTHIIGKWHLGQCNDSCTPTYRGFDSFLGFYNGQEDYYAKTIEGGIDFNDGLTPIKNEEYSTYVYSKRATDIIQNHDKESPLFLYIPFQSVHAPIQVPKKYEDMYPNIKTEQRRQFCGMVTAMDEAIGKITTALKEAGLMDDTLVIFTADNGGWPMFGGNNYPLRGSKVTVFEGGTRAAAFVHGAGLEKTGYTYDGLIHAVDWNPTIVAAAGGPSKPSSYLDGINQWDAIRTGGKSDRTELVYNLDNMIMPPTGHAAIRVGDFKLIQGYPGPFPDWYKPDQVDNSTELDKLLFAKLGENRFFEMKTRQFSNFYDKFGFKGDGLYNLIDDPNERVDISKKYPEVVKQLRAKLDEYRKGLVDPGRTKIDPGSFPEYHGGFWVPDTCSP